PADADGHARAEPGHHLVFAETLLPRLGAHFAGVIGHLVTSVSRLATKASRCSSATPDRFSSKVKPCSKRYERFTSHRSMPFSDSFAARITVGDLAAIWFPIANAVSRSSAWGTTSSTEPKACSSWAVAVADV